MWSVGASYQPSLGVTRTTITKVISLVNVIDDMYDVYGTLDELEQFTNIVRRYVSFTYMELMVLIVVFCFETCINLTYISMMDYLAGISMPLKNFHIT